MTPESSRATPPSTVCRKFESHAGKLVEANGLVLVSRTPSMQHRINLVKVFSATKARDREDIGDRVSAWIAANPGVEIVQTVVAQSSDRSFHCLSLVLICARS